MKQLNSLGFDKKYVINLSYRTDRRAKAFAQFDKVGLKGVEVFTAKTEKDADFGTGGNFITPGMVGCFESHRVIFKEAVDKGWEKLLVMEDDILFAPAANDLVAILFENLPADADFLWLGWNDRLTEKHAKKLIKKTVNDWWFVPDHIWGTHCYAALTRKAIEETYKMLLKPNYQVDVQMVAYQQNTDLKVYCPDPQLAFQSFEDTDIQTQKFQEI